MSNQKAVLAEEYDLMFKILLLGDSGVGKSSLLLRYTKNEFISDLRSTIGVEFALKYLTIDDFQLKVQIWDTAGMERYRSITNAYYKGSKGVIVVYDICRQKSFESVDKWIDDFKSKADDDAVILLIGNKSELDEKREVSKEEAESKAQKNNFGFMETSAKDNNNVQKAFETLFHEIVKIYKNKNNIEFNDNKRIDGEFKKNKKENSNIIKGLAGGYTIQMDVKEDENAFINNDLGGKKCC
jgi:small GTP-binding protein